MLFEWVVVVARCQVVFVIMSKLTKPRVALAGKTDFGTIYLHVNGHGDYDNEKTELNTKHKVWRPPLTDFVHYLAHMTSL